MLRSRDRKHRFIDMMAICATSSCVEMVPTNIVRKDSCSVAGCQHDASNQSPCSLIWHIIYFDIHEQTYLFAEMVATCATSSFVEMVLEMSDRTDTTLSVAIWMPRRKSVGFMPAATDCGVCVCQI